MPVDLRHQFFIIARLADYCDFRRPPPTAGEDPVGYLLRKISETDRPLRELKQELLSGAVERFLREHREGIPPEESFVELRQTLDRFLSPGDFADAAFHLCPQAFADPGRREWSQRCLRGLKARCLLSEEEKPEERRDPAWEKLVSEIGSRLGFPVLEKLVARKPMTRRRLRAVLRRCRLETAEYCSVFRVPLRPDDTFTPFILPRVEALLAANRRLLLRLPHP